MSRAKSQASSSFSLNKIDSKRFIGFNADVRVKLSYEWKNIYRSLLQ